MMYMSGNQTISLHVRDSIIITEAVDVELYINDDKELFKSLFAHKDEIEKNMEMELEWKELPERKASRILIEKTVDLDDRATWPEQFDYIMDTCIKMKRAFKRYL